MTIRDIAIAFGYEVDNKSEKKVEQSISGLKNMAKKAFQAIGLGLSLVKANALVEEFTQVNQQLKDAVGESENFADVQDRILQSANDSRLSYAGMSTYVKGLMNSQNVLFKSVEQTAEFAELTTKAFKAAGANEATINSLNNGIKSAFTTGKVSAGTFQQLMESCPDSVEYLAEMLGVSERQVKALGTAGAITSNQLYSAFAKNAGAIEKSFENTAFTITDAITGIRNKFGTWLYQLNNTLKITHTISKVMTRAFDVIHGALKKVTAFVEKLNNKLGGAEKTLGLFAVIGASLYTAINAGKILSFFKLVGGLLKAGSVKILLIAAAVLAVVMAVEDLINFLQGNDSMFGEVLSSLGINAEETREQLLGALGSIKTALGDLFDTLKSTLGTAFEAIKPSIKTVIELLVKAATQILPVVASVISTVARIVGKIAEAILPVLGEIIGKIIEKTAGIVEKILPKVLQLIEKLMPAVEKIIDAILPILVSLLDLICPLLDAIFAVLEPLIDIVGVLFDLLGPLLDVLTPIITILLQLLDFALTPIIECTKMLATVLGERLSMSFKMIFLKPLVDYLSTLWSFIGKLLTAISNLIGKALNPLKDTWKGIYDAITKFFVGGMEKAMEAVQPIADFLDGIGEKIKVFGSKISGLLGLDNDGTDNAGGLSGLFNGILGMGKPSSSAGVLNNSTSNRTLTQNVTISNQFNGGSADQQKNGANAMKKSAGDATGLLARGLAYAR